MRVFMIVVMLIFVVGCHSQRPPNRDDLIKVLGPISEDAIVLAATRTESCTTAHSGASKNKSLSSEEHESQLWLVASTQPLRSDKEIANLTPRQRTEHSPHFLNRFEENAFPARVIYEIAGVLRVAPEQLKKPSPELLRKPIGRLLEWQANDFRVRIRDVNTGDGWLSVVESFPAKNAG